MEVCSHKVKLTILQGIIQWYLVHSQCLQPPSLFLYQIFYFIYIIYIYFKIDSMFAYTKQKNRKFQQNTVKQKF